MSDLTLGAEFPKASRDDWLALVDKALKGADFDKALVSATYDGVTIAPLYTAEDVAPRAETPGAAPFTRGGHGADGRTPAWQICQIADHPDPKAANAALLEDLERGASALTIRLGAGGVTVATPGDVDTLLDGVLLDLAEIHVDAADRAPAFAALILAHARARKATGGLTGTLGLDPIGRLAATGALPMSLEAGLAMTADFAAHAGAHFPGIRAVRVDTRAWHLAGASEAQEIAVALATGVAYLRALEAAGIGVEEAASQIAFTMTTDADFFTSIAKLRAVRRLWAEATAACGVAPQAMALTIETASRMMARRDPWVNMLRTTVACFAAGIAGADMVAVQPYSAAAGLPDGFARRIARNTQIILQEESALGRVLDPAGGSWYVEHLTDDLAKAGWALFREIEAEGGIAQSLAGGLIQERVAAMQATRATNIARRRDPLTGVSEFAKPDEVPVEVADVDPDAALKDSKARQDAWIAGRPEAPDLSGVPAPGTGAFAAALIAAAGDGATLDELIGALIGKMVTVTPLPRHRLGEAFEALRDRADAHLAATAERPAVFLANLGTPAAYTARSMFARNFFGAAGIEAAASGDCASAEEAVAAWRDTGLPIAVICSSDAVYGAQAAETARALKAAGAAHVYLAGNPGDARAAYEAAGIDSFIHVGCNLPDMLDRALGELGVAS